MDAKDMLKKVKEDNVKFISLQFTDVMGAVKSLDMPIRHLEDVAKDGAWFDSSSVEDFARIQESDNPSPPNPLTPARLESNFLSILLVGSVSDCRRGAL